MKYLANKIEITEPKAKYEVGTDEIEAIQLDSVEKIVQITYKNKKKIKLIPFNSTVDIILIRERVGARIQ